MTSAVSNRAPVTLVLCSKDGASRLQPTLRHIAALSDRSDLQIILVDNGSTDQTQAMMRAFQADVAQTVVVECRRRGNSAGRNDAIAEATGEILLFIDDDCYVDRGFVDAWRQVFQDESIGFGTGMIKPFTPDQSTLGTRTDPEPATFDRGVFLPRGVVQGSNMAFRRQALETERFDETFGAGTPFAGEEWELALRLLRRGWRGVYSPLPVVWHDHGRDLGTAFQQLLYYDYGAGAVYRKSADYGLLNYRRVLAHDLWTAARRPARAVQIAKGALAYMKRRGANT
ncbi:glycosyltransferase family 2 protein [Chthonobacter albigriseus]|uniref:glycosyltransferase family 2 protein n=1 Tax=Chthonobacter albigriseus TaxID=1683161 RepID=UPI0015EFCB62|nr:glycosyltransferase [Chthonobacter albigriseus]